MSNLPKVMAQSIGAAVLKLIGGEAMVLFSPNKELEVRDLIEPTAFPDDIVGFGAAVLRVKYGVAYAAHVDERCRELFGFGLVREGNLVRLGRPEPEPTFAMTGYAYTRDKQGRDMIIGDYAYELNKAYMRLIDAPMRLNSDKGHEYVTNDTARLYLDDLRKLTDWCGDQLIISNIGVRIVPPKEKISKEE